MSTATRALNQIRHLANLNEREALGWADDPALRNRALGACSAYRNCVTYLERVIVDDAAPELLAALLELRGIAANLEDGTYVEPGTIEAAWRMGDHAIAKARGEAGA